MKYILSLLAFLFISGCAVQSGNQSLSEKSGEELNGVLVRGKTKQEEVRNMFGEPDDTDILLDGRLKWVYTHVKRKAMLRNYVPIANWFSSGTDDVTRKLVIVLKDGVVENFSYSTAQGETKGGLLN